MTLLTGFPTHHAAGLAVFAILTAAWQFYFGWRSRFGSRARDLRWFGVALGCGAVVLALGVYALLDRVGLVADWQNLTEQDVGKASQTAMLIGVVEETTKFSAVLLVWALWHRELRSIELFLVSLAVGLGFAAAESTLLLVRGELTPLTLVARAIAAPITHALFTAPWALGLISWLRRGQWTQACWGLFCASFIHGSYDLLVARQGPPSLGAAVIVLLLWIWFNDQMPALEAPAGRSLPAPERTFSLPEVRG